MKKESVCMRDRKVQREGKVDRECNKSVCLLRIKHTTSITHISTNSNNIMFRFTSMIFCP